MLPVRVTKDALVATRKTMTIGNHRNMPMRWSRTRNQIFGRAIILQALDDNLVGLSALRLGGCSCLDKLVP